ncbi:hypothetical protein HQ529_04340 [Candidatus Woesearchaeota archaeon]|nr:hypothetical protein [Candidatus Woesearchaeota archaeon]
MRIPEELEQEIEELKRLRNKKECLRKAYDVLTSKFYGERIKTYTRAYELFILDIHKLWHRKGFMHCTHLNEMMRFLLVGSGFFKDKDIKKKWTILGYFSPHEYLKIKLDDWMNVDIWAQHYGIRFGDYAHGIHGLEII